MIAPLRSIAASRVLISSEIAGKLRQRVTMILLFVPGAGKTEREGTMTLVWRKPKIVEIAVGLEINSYACAQV